MGKYSKSEPDKRQKIVSKNDSSERDIQSISESSSSYLSQIPKLSNGARSFLNIKKEIKKRKRKIRCLKECSDNNAQLMTVKRQEIGKNVKKEQNSEAKEVPIQNISVKQQLNQERDRILSQQNESIDQILQSEMRNPVYDDLRMNIERIVNERMASSMFSFIDRLSSIQGRLRSVQKWINPESSEQEEEEKLDFDFSHPLKEEQILQRLKEEQQRIKQQNQIKLETQIKAEASKSEDIEYIDQIYVSGDLPASDSLNQ